MGLGLVGNICEKCSLDVPVASQSVFPLILTETYRLFQRVFMQGIRVKEASWKLSFPQKYSIHLGTGRSRPEASLQRPNGAKYREMPG